MFRIATFNVENLDDKADSGKPPLEVRAPLLRNMLNRLHADILCLQEVNGQELPEHTSAKPKRNLAALDTVIQGTKYEGFKRAFTTTSAGVPYDERNLVILVDPACTLECEQLKNTVMEKLQYRKVTAIPPDENAKDVIWERPILYAKISSPGKGLLHLINLHLKSQLASSIPGQTEYSTWKSAAGWAEGYFLSCIKQVGQALETRLLVDRIFDGDPHAKVLVCGDFNSEPGSVPVEAICGAVEHTENAALRSRSLIPCSKAIAESVRYTHLHHGKGSLLDHILISQSLFPHFRSAQIYNENLHDESMPYTSDAHFPESDHAPFVAEFA